MVKTCQQLFLYVAHRTSPLRHGKLRFDTVLDLFLTFSDSSTARG